MGYENLLTTSEEGLLTITVNRPKVLNALNAATVAELECAFDGAESDHDVKAVLLTGSGDKAFVAGADIGELQKMKPIEAQRVSERGQRLMDRIASLGKPVAAAINGFALGGGLELAMACTYRTAAETAKVGLPEVSLGIIPGYGGTQRLPRLIGLGRAMEWITTGDMYDANEAYRVGLVNRLFSPGELIAGTEKILRKTMTRAPLAVRHSLLAASKGTEMNQADALRLEASLFGLCTATTDMKEGMSAFLEKRKPSFRGD